MVALPLIHSCGGRVDHSIGWTSGVLGRPVVTFSDSQTDDALSRCPKCGAPLYEAFVAGDFRPDQAKPSTPTTRRTGAATAARVKDGAVKAIQKGLADLAQRRAARAAS